jgi:pimeloyl-ACP methyl ester carboxylesterase
MKTSMKVMAPTNRRRFLLAGAAAGLGLPLAIGKSRTAAAAASDNQTTANLFPGFTAEMVKTGDTTINVLRKGSGRPLLLLHGYPETHLTWHKVAPQLAEQFSVVVPDLRGYGDSGRPPDGEQHENYSFPAMAQDQVDVMRHYGHERFLVAAHDRGARATRRLCLDHPESVEKAVLMDIAPTLTMYEGTNQEFATKYMWWFFLIQPFPVPEHMIALDPKFYLQTVFDDLNKTSGAIPPDVMSEYTRAFQIRRRFTPPVRISKPPRASAWTWIEPMTRPARRSHAHFMCFGPGRERSACCGMCSPPGEQSAPHR